MPRKSRRDAGSAGGAHTPPLLELALREKRNPIEYIRRRRLLGLHVWVVPLRLMPYRGAARMMIGQLMVYEPDDICDLRVHTIESEPSWIFVTAREPRPELSPLARLGEALPTKKKRKKDRKGAMPEKGPAGQPLFIRTVSLRASDKPEGEPDEVVIAVGPDAAAPVFGAPYHVDGMGDLLVTGMWLAGKVPNTLNDLTNDAPTGYTVVRLRIPPQPGS